MERVECSSPAYERLGSAGLIERILEKKEEISDVFLFHFFLQRMGLEREFCRGREMEKRNMGNKKWLEI